MGEAHLIRTTKARKLTMVGIVLIALAVFIIAPQVFLIFVACILFAVFLTALCGVIEHFRAMQRKWSLTFVCSFLLLLAALIVWLVGPQITEQFNNLVQRLPRAIAIVHDRVAGTQFGSELLRQIPDLTDAAGAAGTLRKASGFVSSAFSVVVYAFVILFVGMYLAASPKLYVEAFSKFFPSEKRERVCEVLLHTGVTLRRWLIGRLLLMGTNGVITAVGLAIMGVPLPVTLGIISALLNFVPNFGPIVAAIPAVLIAFLEGTSKALAVAAFYFAYQMFDGYVLTPLVQRRTVSLPPALTIMTQVLFGVLFGTKGVLVAVPLAAIGLVFFREVYQRDVVGE